MLINTTRGSIASTFSETNLIYPPSAQQKSKSVSEQRRTALRKNVIVFIVGVALLLDGMLNMVILPLVPEFLKYMKSSDSTNKLISYFNLKNITNESHIDMSDPSKFARPYID